MGEPAVVRMANDIARQFAHLSPEDAAQAVSGHLRQFWEPRMRRELQAEVERDSHQVSPAVVTAMAASVVEPGPSVVESGPSVVDPGPSVVEPGPSVVEPVETT